jgi:hypothetical protein
MESIDIETDMEYIDTGYIDMIIEDENNKEERKVKLCEKTENSVIVIIPLHCSCIIEEYYMKFEKPPFISIGKRLVQNYEILPFENSYFEDEDFGMICLFPQAKYEFMF